MDRQVTVHMSEGTAFRLRCILPILSTALDGVASDDNETAAMLEQAVSDIDRALPADLRGHIDDRRLAEYRMDAIDAQRKAGVRPNA
jgi:hypothetical protein